MLLPLEQHDLEIQQNKTYWQRKPLLEKIYAQFYRTIQQGLAPSTGLNLELGSGIGQIKKFIPDCITSDLFPNPWLDRQENAYHLSVEAGSVANLILFDVWHHLQFPLMALQEFQRVLTPQGRVLIFDPAMGWLGRFIYGNFHHEPLGFGREINWRTQANESETEAYFAAQAQAWRMFHRGEGKVHLKGWNIVHLELFSALDYVASGGFRGPQLYPTATHGLVQLLDQACSFFPEIFATRMLVVLERVK